MKKLLYSINLLLVILIAGTTAFAQREATRDSVTMTPGYAQDIYYSFENGEVSAVDRANWDIAFYTPKFSAGIMINDASGVRLYTYPNGDTAAWNNVDTTGLHSSWTPMFNSLEIWEDGAFNVNSGNHPDYGWGKYNDATHNVVGDSLYIIKLSETVFKKLWIKQKISIDNIYEFMFADLDGSNEQKVSFDVEPIEDKRFAYYSLTNNTPVNREPIKDSWDIVFGQYVVVFDIGMGETMEQVVTGVMSNVDIGANHNNPVAGDFNDWGAMPFDSTKTKIGYEWKKFDFNSFSYFIVDSTAFFVQNYKGDVYKLVFESFAGSSSGNISFDKELISLASVPQFERVESSFSVYPNPASAVFTIKSAEELNGNATVVIYDQSGRSVYNTIRSASDLQSGLSVNDLDLSKGLYIITISGENYSGSQKLLIK